MKQHELPPICWCAAACSSSPADVCCCLYKQQTADTQHTKPMSLLTSRHPCRYHGGVHPAYAIPAAIAFIAFCIWSVCRAGDRPTPTPPAEGGDNEGRP